MVNNRTFILGVGAQKAGTTWLHSYIASNANANMGFAKEYHIWDAVYSPLCKKFKIHEARVSQLNTADYLRYCMQNIPGFYEEYFNSIFNSGAQLTGDITPSYCALTEDNFHILKGKIKFMGAKVRCIFIMRDPVERCWSSVRMALRDTGVSHDEARILRQKYSSEPFQLRTRYEITCERLRNVFAEEELYFGFYETMFDDSELERLSKFLGVPANYEHQKKLLNTSPKTSDISICLREEIRRFYSSTYAYCFEKFRDTKLLWK